MIPGISGEHLYALVMAFGAAQEVRALPSFHEAQGKGVIGNAGVENHGQGQLVPHCGVFVRHIGKCGWSIVHGARHISGERDGAVMDRIGKITPLVMFHSHDPFRCHKIGPGSSLSHGLYGAVEIDHQLMADHEIGHHVVLPHGMLGIILKEVYFQAIHSPACPERNQLLCLFPGIEALHGSPDPDLNAFFVGIIA